MAAIRIICVGKLTEKYFQPAIEEYSLRLSRFAKVELVEVKEEKVGNDHQRVLDAEAERIMKQLHTSDTVISLCVDGESLHSVEFARFLQAKMLNGDVVFVIGGPLGIGEAVLKRCNLKLSFSSFTFPHQMLRVLLLEQLYRAMTILKGVGYHK
ncbi:23S rRNA (pseudouridine(1915)-N(3))-methyltransferase RlmH [Candidatus Woesearchaeota archaeon]|nr:23S rRNA (pseudouridine(1915)-N(3))-methyltransferase RlmH [Candidatus Woesearchaeota archaeon]